MSKAVQVKEPTVSCKICGMKAEFFDESEVLRKYAVKYFRCAACGFVQSETPYWLEEAYSSAMSKQDTGALMRNLLNQRITTSVLKLLYPGVGQSLDFGAGHGIFVRLMRDSGFEFYWYDLHAKNDYAGGFEDEKTKTYNFLTSFEVLEHLVDPITELSTMMARSPNVFISTTLLPNPTPKVLDWWYYNPLGGQHVSFYTLDALRLIARRFGRKLLSRGTYHLFTTAPKSNFLFRLGTSQRASQILHAVWKRPSLINSDFQLLSRR